jgi:alpha-glucuronidase
VKKCVFIVLAILFCVNAQAENGYELWLRYVKVNDQALFDNYRSLLKQLVFPGNSETIKAAQKELQMGLQGLLEVKLPVSQTVNTDNTLLIANAAELPASAKQLFTADLKNLGNEGYLIRASRINNLQTIVITANSDIGVLYGVFNFLKLIQTQADISNLSITEKPKIKYRILNHWDNLNGTIERGYAGSSIWDWQRLPGFIDPRYVDYARANASIGINGTVLNNVNANTKSLTKEYIIKAAALANAFRPYGIKVYLTAKFSAPKEIGGLTTADPFDAGVIKWWKDKTDEIYQYIPDFGGYLVKANSEGQPGPQNYKRTHADGANMMAKALAPHGGIVMWRTFVYENKKGQDRAKMAYDEFKKFDGQFDANVFIQPKNGPIDFQPREPQHPLFGAMPKTPQMLEFEITQEYLGFATTLAYLAPLFKETLSADTYSQGKGSTIAKIVDGSLEKHTMSGIAGVANIGSDVNWCGHPFGQANWYSFGRMAWNPGSDSEAIADEWLKMTFTNDKDFVAPVKQLMLDSRETVVKYMMPLGLNHVMNLGSHYGPGPWDKIPGWNAHDYHMADSVGLGFDRTTSGSNAVGQYFPPVRDKFNNVKTTPNELLLWFHHVPWSYKMPSGRTLWNELVNEYYSGVSRVENMQTTWNKMEGKIDAQRFNEVKQLLAEQQREAAWWRDGSVLYFQTFSKLPLPAGLKQPAFPLSHYKEIKFPDRTN